MMAGKLSGVINFLYEMFAVFATIAVLGMKIVSQINGSLSAIGDLSRLSGSIEPVFEILEMQQASRKKNIQEEIKSISTKSGHFKINALASLYGNFKFAPIILLFLTASGLLIQTGDELKFNIALVSLLLTLLNIFFFVISVW